MPVSQPCDVPTNSPALARLVEFARQLASTGKPVDDFDAFEREVRQRFAEAERELLGSELAKYDIDAERLEIEGRTCQRVLRCEQTYFTAAGPVRVMRSLYRGPGASLCPLELRAGIVDGRWTPMAARQAIWVVAHVPPQEGERFFRLLGGMTPSKSSLDRLPKHVSDRWERDRLEFEEKLRAASVVPESAVSVAVSIDGIRVPMKDGERQRKREVAAAQGLRTTGPAGFKDVGCATLSFFDASGGRLSTVRMARMPEPSKVTLKGQLRAELEAALGKRPQLKVVKVADGARDNWEYFAKELPSGVEVLDYYHAAEHLNWALISAYGETDPRKGAQFDRLRRLLRDDARGVDKVIRALIHLRERFPRRKMISDQLAYFRKNRGRMQYAKHAGANLPIGSGVVEAACKTLAAQRMKCSGMRWRERGGQAILTFRALIQSDRFELGWQLLADTYKARIRRLPPTLRLAA